MTGFFSSKFSTTKIDKPKSTFFAIFFFEYFSIKKIDEKFSGHFFENFRFLFFRHDEKIFLVRFFLHVGLCLYTTRKMIRITREVFGYVWRGPQFWDFSKNHEKSCNLARFHSFSYYIMEPPTRVFPISGATFFTLTELISWIPRSDLRIFLFSNLIIHSSHQKKLFGTGYGRSSSRTRFCFFFRFENFREPPPTYLESVS